MFFLKFGLKLQQGERKLKKFPNTAQFIPTKVCGGDCTIHLLCRAGSNDSEHAQLNLQMGSLTLQSTLYVFEVYGTIPVCVCLSVVCISFYLNKYDKLYSNCESVYSVKYYL